jgi:hypothetical protein
MSTVITIGNRLIPSEQIALVEPFDRAANPRLRTDRDFQGRIVLTNRDSVLTEQAPVAFAQANGFRILEEDQVAANPAVSFRVETFEPGEGFQPSKPYLSRLRWRDGDGNDQSKLLLTKPEAVLAVVVQGGPDAKAARSNASSRPRRRRRAEPAPEQQ